MKNVLWSVRYVRPRVEVVESFRNVLEHTMESKGKDRIRVRMVWSSTLSGLSYFIGTSDREVGGSESGENVVGEGGRRSGLGQGVGEDTSLCKVMQGFRWEVEVAEEPNDIFVTLVHWHHSSSYRNINC